MTACTRAWQVRRQLLFLVLLVSPSSVFELSVGVDSHTTHFSQPCRLYHGGGARDGQGGAGDRRVIRRCHAEEHRGTREGQRGQVRIDAIVVNTENFYQICKSATM